MKTSRIPGFVCITPKGVRERWVHVSVIQRLDEHYTGNAEILISESDHLDWEQLEVPFEEFKQRMVVAQEPIIDLSDF